MLKWLLPCCPAIVVYCAQQPTRSPRFPNCNSHWRTSAMGQHWRQARIAKADESLPCDAMDVCRCMLNMSVRMGVAWCLLQHDAWLRLRSWWLERTVVASTKSPERMSDRMPDSARTYTGEPEELASCFVAHSMQLARALTAQNMYILCTLNPGG